MIVLLCIEIGTNLFSILAFELWFVIHIVIKVNSVMRNKELTRSHVQHDIFCARNMSICRSTFVGTVVSRNEIF